MSEQTYQIYLDNAAMTRPLPCAIEAFKDAPFGNPSSEHAFGLNASKALEQSREKIARLMGCKPWEIYFTSTATEAAALALNSAWLHAYTFLSSPFEHHAVSENIMRPLNVDASLGKVVCQMYANNETGEILSYPSDKIKNGDLFLCDATAAIGHVPVRFDGMSYLMADTIKFGGIPGAAFLIARTGAPLYPMIRGGGQEHGMRAGTENVPAICAMAAALEWQAEHMEENTAKLNAMRSVLIDKLSKIPLHDWNTPLHSPCVPHILNISFYGVNAHALALLLSRDGVMVSAGAACSNGLNTPSHVIMAMFHDEERARSAIRISLSHENTVKECVEAARKIAAAVEFLRSIG